MTVIENASSTFKLEFPDARAKIISAIEEVYGNEKAQKVDKGTIWVGMPMHLLLVAMGKAFEIKNNNNKDTSIEKWYYGVYRNRLGNYKYKLEITLENNFVIGWKDLV